MCLTAEGIILCPSQYSQGNSSLSRPSIHSVPLPLSHDIGPFVPDFVPLFSPRLESSGVEKMLLKSRDLVAFDSSVQDEGRAKAKDVSQQWVEL